MNERKRDRDNGVATNSALIEWETATRQTRIFVRTSGARTDRPEDRADRTLIEVRWYHEAVMVQPR